MKEKLSAYKEMCVYLDWEVDILLHNNSTGVRQGRIILEAIHILNLT